MKTKGIIVLLILIISTACFQKLFAQSDNEYFEMINTSFLKYIEIEETYVERGIILPSDHSKEYILCDNYPRTFEFSPEIEKMGFKYLSLKNFDKSIPKQSWPVIVYDGPEIKGDMIIITFTGWWVEYKDEELFIEVGSHWVNCTWKYSKKKKKWVLFKVEDGGI